MIAQAVLRSLWRYLEQSVPVSFIEVVHGFFFRLLARGCELGFSMHSARPYHSGFRIRIYQKIKRYQIVYEFDDRPGNLSYIYLALANRCFIVDEVLKLRCTIELWHFWRV